MVSLDDAAATDPSVAGAKAASLARARALHLPVLPGVVLTASAPTDALVQGTGPLPDAVARPLQLAWSRLARQGAGGAVAVRSSSEAEDGTSSSMAGMFTSVLDVTTWSAVVEAVAAVLRSAGDHPMAVLVQPMLHPRQGGVLFGVDPVTGRLDQLVVESVAGGPASLVSGIEAGVRHVLSPRGRLLEVDRGRPEARLARRDRIALARLAAAAARVFHGPQDIEWAIDGRGKLWLLQSRPVTAVADGHPVGPRLGPGPVAETFPRPLSRLEADLWVPPLREGISHAISIAGLGSARALARSPVVEVVAGRVAADLDLLDPAVGGSGILRRLDPRPPGRRLAAAWRVGRLRRALPLLAADVVATLDRHLADVPPLSSMADADLLRLLRGSREALRAVHGHEVLAGLLGSTAGTTGAALALDALVEGRRAGLADDELVAAFPAVLALTPPAIERVALPVASARLGGGAGTNGSLGPREALRLRARWLQELQARAALEAGRRLAAAGELPEAELVRHLSLGELADALERHLVPDDLLRRAAEPASPPLPLAFRRTASGGVVAERRGRGRRLEGRGAGGGRAQGRVVHEPVDGDLDGHVLVVSALEPGLAASLPGLAGLVAETGSVLSHLAILARELGVPTVVGVADARRRFPPGTVVVLDGTTGEVVGAGDERAAT